MRLIKIFVVAVVALSLVACSVSAAGNDTKEYQYYQEKFEQKITDFLVGNATVEEMNEFLTEFDQFVSSSSLDKLAKDKQLESNRLYKEAFQTDDGDTFTKAAKLNYEAMTIVNENAE